MPALENDDRCEYLFHNRVKSMFNYVDNKQIPGFLPMKKTNLFFCYCK